MCTPSDGGDVILSDFKRSLAHDAPPMGLTPALMALWWASKGDWNRAHELVQDESGKDTAWVHAYLHRVEGDIANARYWYGSAGRPPVSSAFDIEWGQIALTLLGSRGQD